MTAQEPRLNTVACLHASAGGAGLHRMAWWEWGDAANPAVVVCVHGLTRQGRDFDVLAHALSRDFRVVCPDVVGRGESDRLADPAGYAVPQYVADMVTLLARLDARQVDWVGTSMGGLIGIGLAGLQGSPIRRMVVNDVGPALAPEGLRRIAAYAGQPRQWATADEAIAWLRGVCAPFGPHTPEQWAALSRPMLRPAPAGGWQLHYDPRIALPFAGLTPELAALGEQLAWRAWDAIQAEVLLVRGAESDLLAPATALAMTQRGPRPRLHEVPGVGHAPTLVDPAQVEVITQWLRR